MSSMPGAAAGHPPLPASRVLPAQTSPASGPGGGQGRLPWPGVRDRVDHSGGPARGLRDRCEPGTTAPDDTTAMGGTASCIRAACGRSVLVEAFGVRVDGCLPEPCREADGNGASQPGMPSAVGQVGKRGGAMAAIVMRGTARGAGLTGLTSLRARAWEMAQRATGYVAGAVMVCAVGAALLQLAVQILSFSGPIAVTGITVMTAAALNLLRRRVSHPKTLARTAVGRPSPPREF